MAINEIAVNTRTLSGDINELRTALSNVRAQLKGMFGEITELDTMWDGPANEEFNRQFGIDYENARKLCTTIDSLVACMEFARSQYDICESEINSIISSIRI